MAIKSQTDTLLGWRRRRAYQAGDLSACGHMGARLDEKLAQSTRDARRDDQRSQFRCPFVERGAASSDARPAGFPLGAQCRLELLEASALEIGPGLRLPGTDLLAMDQRCLYCYLMQYAQLEAARKRAEELEAQFALERDRSRFTARR